MFYARGAFATCDGIPNSLFIACIGDTIYSAFAACPTPGLWRITPSLWLHHLRQHDKQQKIHPRLKSEDMTDLCH